MKIVDVLVYVHPELSAEERSKIEREVAGSAGVISANFDKHTHPHALTIQYDPDAVQSAQILDAVRRHDPVATMTGL